MKKKLAILILLPVIVILSLFGLLLKLNNESSDSDANKTVNQTNFITAGVYGRDNIEIQLELARSNKELEQGLMNRKSLEENHGMLFIFNKPQKLSFWMKNTLIPLDIAFLDENKEIIDIYANCEAENTDKIYKSSRSAIYAIEMNANWFENNRIKPGDKFDF